MSPVVSRPNAVGPRRKLREREADALTRLARGDKPSAVAAELAVDRSQVSRWRRKFRALALLPAVQS